MSCQRGAHGVLVLAPSRDEPLGLHHGEHRLVHGSVRGEGLNCPVEDFPAKDLTVSQRMRQAVGAITEIDELNVILQLSPLRGRRVGRDLDQQPG